MPGWTLLTTPPTPVMLTVSANSWSMNVAVTARACVMLTMQVGFAPKIAQEPPQLSNVVPVCGRRREGHERSAGEQPPSSPGTGRSGCTRCPADSRTPNRWTAALPIRFTVSGKPVGDDVKFAETLTWAPAW